MKKLSKKLNKEKKQKLYYPKLDKDNECYTFNKDQRQETTEITPGPGEYNIELLNKIHLKNV